MADRWQWIALALSLALTGLLVAVTLVEAGPEWASYQREFGRRFADPGNPAPASDFQPEIRQVKIDALNRVDRCATCHLGTIDARRADAPEPFRTHSPLLASHPTQVYGCTICHGGEGRAVTVAEAHGNIPGQNGRLIPAALRPAACHLCHGSPTTVGPGTGTIAEGIKLINEYKCLRCHQIDGAGGSVGPDLSAVASQRNWVQVYAHLLKPDALAPGSTMPDFGLRRFEATAITAFLLTRLEPADRVLDVYYLADPLPAATSVGVSAAPAGALAADQPSASTLRYDGESLFEGLECAVCHRVGLRGGQVGPALTRIGRTREETWLRDLVVDPSRAFPNGQMPVYDLSQAQAAALVRFLSGLR